MSLHAWLRSGLTSVLMWIIKMITRGRILTSSMTLTLRGKLVRGEIIQNTYWLWLYSSWLQWLARGGSERCSWYCTRRKGQVQCHQISWSLVSPNKVLWSKRSRGIWVNIDQFVKWGWKMRCFRSGDQCSLGIGYYTQLVWQNTTHVGCGWSQFQYRGFAVSLLVCRQV